MGSLDLPCCLIETPACPLLTLRSLKVVWNYLAVKFISQQFHFRIFLFVCLFVFLPFRCECYAACYGVCQTECSFVVMIHLLHYSISETC